MSLIVIRLGESGQSGMTVVDGVDGVVEMQANPIMEYELSCTLS